MFKLEVVSVDIDQAYIDQLREDASLAFELTGESLLTDLRNSKTMPFATGHLQNDNTFVDKSWLRAGQINIVSSTPYARRLYFNPQFNFRKDHNPHAGGRWFDPYLPGHSLQHFVRDAFSGHFERLRRGK